MEERKVSPHPSGKDLEDVLDELSRALEKTPEDKGILLQKAYALFRLGFYDECLAVCRGVGKGESCKWEFVLLESACENWIFRREKILNKIGAFAPVPRAELFDDIGTILGVFCDVSEASYYLSGLLKKEQNERIWYLLGRLHRADGRLKESLGCIEKALGIVNNFEPALKLKEKIRVEILRGATRAAKTGGYLESVPVQEARAGFSAEDWFVRGLGNMRTNNFNAALKSFAEALKCEAQFHICWYYAGKAQEKLGGEAKARQCYKKFIDGFPRSSAYYKDRLLKAPPEAERKYLEGLYHRWIGFCPEDHRAWMAYLKYLMDINDGQAVRLLASDIVQNRIGKWFIDSASPQFFLIKGMIELVLCRTRTARNSFSQALKSKTVDSFAYLGIGKAYELVGNYSEAELNYNKVAQLKPSSIMGLYQRAHVNLLKKSEKGAVESIDDALKLMGSSILLKGKRAEILLEFSDLKGFMEYFTSIVDKEYLHIHLDLMKGMALYKAHKNDEAIWEIEAVRTRNPGNPLVLKTLGILYLNTGRYEKVRDIIEELKKAKDFESEIFLLQGLSYYFMGEHKESLDFLESYLNLCPLDPRVWTFIALDWYGMGNQEISEMSFVKANDLSNGLSYTWLNLAIYFCNRAQYKKAARCIAKVNEHEKGSPAYHLCQARYLRAFSNLGDALNSVEEVLKKEPSHITALILAALIEFDLRAFSKCLGHISQALEIESTRVELTYVKGVTQLFLGDSNAALETINKALSEKPDFYDAWLAKAVLYWSINDLKEAGEALKGAQNLKPKEFGEWLRFASSQKDHLSAIKLDIPLELPFYTPETFPLRVEEPLSIFKYDKLDSIFK